MHNPKEVHSVLRKKTLKWPLKAGTGSPGHTYDSNKRYNQEFLTNSDANLILSVPMLIPPLSKL